MTAPKLSETARKAMNRIIDEHKGAWAGVLVQQEWLCEVIQAAIDEQAKPLAEALRETVEAMERCGMHVDLLTGAGEHQALRAARKALEAYEEGC